MKPHPKQNHSRLRLRGRNFTAVDVWNGARAGHSPLSESACASGQLFAVPCKTHPQRAPHTFSVVIKARLAPLSYLGTFLLHQFFTLARWALALGVFPSPVDIIIS